MDALSVFVIITCIQICTAAQIYIVKSLFCAVKAAVKNVLDDD